MKHFYFSMLALFFFSGTHAQIINFPDANFKAKLMQSGPGQSYCADINGDAVVIDANNDNEIDVSEALAVYRMTINGTLSTPNNNIVNLQGVSAFTNLRQLDCGENSITSLDLTGLINLETVSCIYNHISSVNVSGLTHLKELNLSSNQMTSFSAINFQGTANIETLTFFFNYMTGAVDLTGFHNLKIASFSNNNLSSINVNGLNFLEKLEFGNNELTSIDLTTNPNFQYINCSGNNLTSLDVSQNPLLDHIYCSYNQLTTLDLTHNHQFFYLDIRNNNLTSMFIKNGGGDVIQLNNNPNLAYICADELELTNQMLYYNPLTEVNSYCNFVPGSNYYTVQGNAKFDYDENGCDNNDFNYPYFKISITDGSNVGTIVSNATGNYSIPVEQGMHTLTPVLEHPSYFNISPASVIVNFPADTNPNNQNFCITPNGVHQDLEIAMLPIGSARPGFDAVYKINIKNKGNQVQSGSVTLAYEDAVLDFVSANPGVFSQFPNSLVFDFDTLLPFETKGIMVTFNINSPVENPPVNNGAILTYTAALNTASDETPADNTFALHQTVVNSFDPNDKTCLEGNTITPEMVGKEVHYLIRFENTGTANAQNIVVKDMIDTTKFDINSLIPIDGSHPFGTKISNTNKVEFIFENINLPFDDANNDGYVAFKIKTKPSLILGDTFSNTASIYFDYNFPIITNTATTTVALLANPDFAFEQYFKIYPNPVKDILNIETKKSIEVTSINIYNTLGQLVLVIPNAQQTKSVDVSSLKTGNYFLKINSDKGSSSVKFVKM